MGLRYADRRLFGQRPADRLSGGGSGAGLYASRAVYELFARFFPAQAVA